MPIAFIIKKLLRPLPPSPKDRAPTPALWRVMGLSLVVLAMVALGAPAWCQEKNDSNPPTAPDKLQVSIESALASHRVELADIEAQMAQLENLQVSIHDQIVAYETETAAHTQLLMVPNLQMATLENAIARNRLSAKKLSEQLASLRVRLDAAANASRQTTERIELAREQIDGLREADLPGVRKQDLEKASRALVKVLQDKSRLNDRYLEIHEALIDQVQSASDVNRELGAKLTALLENRRKTSLFQRSNPYQGALVAAFPEALSRLWSRLGALFSPAMWRAQLDLITIDGFYRWAVFLFWLGLVVGAQVRFRPILERFENEHPEPEWHYRRLGVLLLRRSLLYLGLALLFGIYSSLRLPVLDIGLGRTLAWIFLVLLLARWGLDFLKLGHRGSDTTVRTFVTRKLRRLFRLLRAMLIVLILLEWVVGRENLLYLVVRDAVAVGLLAWTLAFWRRFRTVSGAGARQGEALPDHRRLALLRGWSYLVTGGGLVIAAYGYRMLAGHWAVAWMDTVALLFWGWIGLNAIGEWRRDLQARMAAADAQHPLGSGYHLRWSLVQLVRVAWFFVLAGGLVWIWDSSGILIGHLRNVFGATFSIGSLELSVNGIVLAAAILFLTYLLVRLGRALLDEKVLVKKDLEPGFRSSILTVSGYLAWGIGLILAMGTLGVNATSLAVIFGALSVGIGFGLQNIFNNFISGLILLFERPIQVGDNIEINGMWAQVRQINVRATVVRTPDNAALIIPNSEFISKQVTNWNFKDRRMRRNIEVGVAYGSDIDLVSKTLLEIALNTREALKVPRPDVIFIDHGPSTLVFRLRVWVHVDNYWPVPSKIRSEIDRRFRELGIEIAFPQQDVHIRDLPQAFSAVDPAARTNGNLDGQE